MTTNITKSNITITTNDKSGIKTWASPDITWSTAFYRWSNDGVLPSANQNKSVVTKSTVNKSTI